MATPERRQASPARASGWIDRIECIGSSVDGVRTTSSLGLPGINRHSLHSHATLTSTSYWEVLRVGLICDRLIG